YLYNETIEVLEKLKGKYELLMLTNGSPDLQQMKLSLSPELAPYFKHIVISGDFGKGKPSQEIFKYALSLLDVDKDRKSTRLNSSHVSISYAVFCLKKKNTKTTN